jgi:hypothetical protein
VIKLKANRQTIRRQILTWGPFQNGLAKFSMNIGGNTTDTYDARDGFIDKTRKIVIEPEFGDAENFSDGLAMVAEDKKRDDGLPAENKIAKTAKTLKISRSTLYRYRNR